jgi:hypothetical protein
LETSISVDLNWEKRRSRLPFIEQRHREFGGYICCKKIKARVSSTGPFPGTWRFVSNDGDEYYSDNPLELTQKGGTSTTGNGPWHFITPILPQGETYRQGIQGGPTQTGFPLREAPPETDGFGCMTLWLDSF